MSALAAAPHVLYAESHVTTPGQNALLAYDIAADARLSAKRGSPYLLGGTGYFDPSFDLGPYDNDQSIVFNADKSLLYAINGGSSTIAIMRVASDGSLSPCRALRSPRMAVHRFRSAFMAIRWSPPTTRSIGQHRRATSIHI